METVLSIKSVAYANRGTNDSCPVTTITVAVPDIDPELAVILGLPMPVPVASPPLEIEAMVISDEAHCTTPVTSPVLPSSYWPIAENWSVAPTVIVEFFGPTSIAVSFFCEGGWLGPPPHPAINVNSDKHANVLSPCFEPR